MAEANRIKALYDQTVISAMVKKFNYKTPGREDEGEEIVEE